MDARLKSPLTLGVLGVLLRRRGRVGHLGTHQAVPRDGDPPACVDVAFAKGERIVRGDVTVSVLNAGTRNGLAGLTMDLFVDAGFAAGQEGNANERAKVDNVEIWTDDPRHPAVQLVAGQLGDAVEVVRRDPSAAGVQVVSATSSRTSSTGRAGSSRASDVDGVRAAHRR